MVRALTLDSENVLEREQRALEIGMKEQRIDGEIITLDSYLRKGIEI